LYGEGVSKRKETFMTMGTFTRVSSIISWRHSVTNDQLFSMPDVAEPL
jgi:hypothetical protein